MRINHNIGALNAWRNLMKTNSALDKSLERLSSGLRINRAADDAAGLAISEKMRAQINGLNTAGRNAQDAISLIQTAEGALEESHAILQRVRELAVQGSSDTMTTEDRAKLQSEVNELAKELGRIGKTTEFNTKKLLDGSFDGKFQIGANSGQNLQVAIDDMRGYALGVLGDAKLSGETGNVTDGGDANTDIADGTYTVQSDGSGGYEMVDSNGTAVATSADGKAWTASTGDDTLAFTEAVVDGTVTIAAGAATATSTVNNTGLEAGDYTLEFAAGASTIVDSEGNVVASSTDDTTFKDADGTTVLTLSAAATGDREFTIGGMDITATDAISTLDTAIDDVATQRSSLGAVQNRLEHTINNLSTAAENLTAAEARIRDVDMAKEMTAFTRAQILSQSGTAMLAQANIRPQSVLSLLG